MDIKSKLASNMRNQILKQYKLNETKRELKKKDSKITSVIYYNNEGVLIGYNNGKLKSASSLSAAKAGNLTDTTIKKDGERLSPVQINDMNKTYRQIWQFEGETYGVKPGKIERLENGGGDITNIGDVKGWNPEYQIILETFDMINNKYENPDVSKDLNIQHINAWNNSITPSEGSTFASSFTWNTPLNPNTANGVRFEIYTRMYNYISGNNISKFLYIYNNEKKDRMFKIFQIPKMSNYNETEKPKRMEMGYYCKDKKEFKTLFNNKSFTNGKHVEDIDTLYYILYNGYLSTMNEPLTIGHLLTLRKNEVYDKTNGNQTLRYRYFKTIKNYLSNISDKYGLEFNNSYDNDYSGGGGINSILDYNKRLYNFNHFLQTCGIIDMFGAGNYFEKHYNKYDDKNKDFTDRIIRGELVTSTEMNEIINIPHTLADGTESYYTFAESFAHHCGWYTQNTIAPKTTVISDITWTTDNLAYPKYITLHNDYIC